MAKPFRLLHEQRSSERRAQVEEETRHLLAEMPFVNAYLRVRFLTPEEGGRRTALGRGLVRDYRAPFLIDGEAFDCRITLPPEGLDLGVTYEDVPVIFLWPQLVLPLLSVGKAFDLWEGHIVAHGTVTHMPALGE